MRFQPCLFAGMVALAGLSVSGLPSHSASLEGAEDAKAVVYKTAGGADLRLYIFQPEPKGKEPRAAAIFFHGGAWRAGSPRQFIEHCRYFASRGMVAVSAEYRLTSRHGVTPFECVADAKSAVRWLRAHANELGIDPDRIAAGGGSAGGHLAACAGVIRGLDDEGEDPALSSRPDALVLFNPAVDLVRFAERAGKPREWAERISPLRHVREGLPPTIMFHGTDDKTVPFESVETFCRLMQAKGNTCRLVPFEGKGHGFFNYGREGNVSFHETIRAADAFLTRLGFLEPTADTAPVKGETMSRDTKEITVYVGTYTKAEGGGIHLGRLDMESGELRMEGVAAPAKNPSFLALDSRCRFLYAVNEIAEYANRRSGAVSAYDVDPATGALTLRGSRPSHGRGPCHVSVDPSDRFVLVANYTEGSIALFPIRPDGTLGEAAATVQHEGSGPHPTRQKGPHAHSIYADPTGRFVFAVDLGLDRVMIYRLDPDTGSLAPNDPPFVELAPGAGPRHMEFHPNGRFAYVINELGNTITAFAFDPEEGALDEIQTVPTLPDDFEGENTTADIHITPSGAFLYGSNRGHNSLAVFRVDGTTGKLEPVGHEPTQGKTPRNFGIDPTGTFLLAANQDSDTIVGFRIDPDTGRLTPTGHAVSVPKPVCVKMVPLVPGKRP